MDTALNWIAENIGTIPLAALLREALRRSATALNVERLSYWTLEADHSTIDRVEQFLASHASFDASPVRLSSADFPGYFEALQRHAGLILSDEVMADPRLQEFCENYFKPLGITSMLDAPVRRRGRTFGVICHEHVGAARRWTEAEAGFARSVSHLVALAIETEERQAAEVATRVNKARYHTLFEHTPAAIVVLDADTGRFVEVNENAVRLYGRPREELLQTGPIELSPALQPDGTASADAAREHIHRALRGEATAFEWLHRDHDGREILCEIRAARMPASDQNLVVGAILDVTDRKRAEAELRRALEREKELSELKTSFVNVVSHEFRTPLGVIMSAADILEHYFDRLSPEQRADHLQDIHHSARQMSELMEEVLLLGRVESGRMECRPAEMNLAEFCRSLVDEQLSATHRRCPISLSLDGVRGHAMADETLLRHLLSNLLANAVKYSPAGAEVRFSVSRQNDRAVFEIRDHGIGIPPEDQARLFQPFHRGGNVGEIPGTGLGLVIAKRCVEAHGGTMALTSETGRGTSFAVELNLFKPAPSERHRGPSRYKRGKSRKPS